MIMTVIRNLTTNTITFTPDGGIILIRASEKNANLEVSISDTGVGMTDDTVQKLFRIDTSKSTLGTNNEKGTGLGLILCKEFVEKHRGRIRVESEVGKGSTFYFTLPKKFDK